MLRCRVDVDRPMLDNIKSKHIQRFELVREGRHLQLVRDEVESDKVQLLVVLAIGTTSNTTTEISFV